MEEEKVISMFDKYFEKNKVTVRDRFLVARKMMETYWEEWAYPTKEEPEEDSELDDMAGEEGEEVAMPEPPKPPKRRDAIKKPKVAIKDEDDF